MPHSPRIRGYSLIETAIVLTIIAIAIGGTLMGRSLIRDAEVREILTSVEEYRQAIREFDTQYGGLPGDISSSVPLWAEVVTTYGNGDGRIEWGTEGLAAWQHLTLAKIIKGSYSGRGNEAIAGVNVPASKMQNGGFSFIGIDANYATMFTNPAPTGLIGNYLAFGSLEVRSYTSGGILTPQEAWSIDKKVDDGIADAGSILGPALINLFPPRCIITHHGRAIYDTGAAETPVCNMHFIVTVQ